MHLSILITRLLDSAWILQGEVTHESLLGFKGLTTLGAYSEAPS